MILDEPLSDIPERIRLTIENYDELPIAVGRYIFLDKSQDIHQKLAASGYQSRNKKMVDSDMRAERPMRFIWLVQLLRNAISF